MPIYRGVGGANREIKAIYRGISGVNRPIKQIYRGVNGTNRLVFRGKYGLDEIAQVVFKVYSASAVSLNNNTVYSNLKMKTTAFNVGGKIVAKYSFLPEESVMIPCASIQLSGEYKIQFSDGTEVPFNHQALSENLGITNMTMKYCMGSFAVGDKDSNTMTGILQALDQQETTLVRFSEMTTKGIILKKSVSYMNKYPQTSLANLSVYAGKYKNQYPTSLDYFTSWLGETGLNHVFLQKGQYTYESDIIIVDARN